MCKLIRRVPNMYRFDVFKRGQTNNNLKQYFNQQIPFLLNVVHAELLQFLSSNSLALCEMIRVAFL